MIRSPQGTQGKSWPAILIGMFVAFGGVLYGYVNEPGNLTSVTYLHLLQL